MCEAETEPLRLILVLGAAVRADGAPSAALVRRLERALQEFERAPTTTILMPTGGQGRVGPPEAAVMADWLAARGVPRPHLYPVAQGSNTRRSLAACLSALSRLERQPERLLLCSDAYHMPRCRMILGVWGLASAGLACAPPGRWVQVRASVRECPAFIKDFVLSLLRAPPLRLRPTANGGGVRRRAR